MEPLEPSVIQENRLYTRNEVSQILGVSPDMVSDWIRGRSQYKTYDEPLVAIFLGGGRGYRIWGADLIHFLRTSLRGPKQQTPPS